MPLRERLKLPSASVKPVNHSINSGLILKYFPFLSFKTRRSSNFNFKSAY